jgi:hypothetical protein
MKCKKFNTETDTKVKPTMLKLVPFDGDPGISLIGPNPSQEKISPRTGRAAQPKPYIERFFNRWFQQNVQHVPLLLFIQGFAQYFQRIS